MKKVAVMEALIDVGTSWDNLEIRVFETMAADEEANNVAVRLKVCTYLLTHLTTYSLTHLTIYLLTHLTIYLLTHLTIRFTRKNSTKMRRLILKSPVHTAKVEVLRRWFPQDKFGIPTRCSNRQCTWPTRPTGIVT